METNRDDLIALFGYLEVTGNLTIGGPGDGLVVSLKGLENLTSVGGNLQISVDDRFLIYDNTNLCENLAEDLRDQVIACPRGGIVGSILIEDNKTCP